LRYAATFAGGALLTALAFEFGFESQGRPGVSQLVGTMVDHRRAGEAVLSDAVRVDLEQVRGDVRLFEINSILLVEFDLALQQPVEIVASFDGQEARLVGGSTRTGPKHERFAMTLGTTRGGSVVTVRFYVDGELLGQEALEVSADR
jgi:hypothetical protein